MPTHCSRPVETSRLILACSARAYEAIAVINTITVHDTINRGIARPPDQKVIRLHSDFSLGISDTILAEPELTDLPPPILRYSKEKPPTKKSGVSATIQRRRTTD